MRLPICNILSLAIPILVGSVGFYRATHAKGLPHGAAAAPALLLAILLTLSALLGEVLAVVALFRGENLAWLSWLGVLVNGAILMFAVYIVFGK